MELSQAQHAGFSLYLCVQHAPVKDASLPHHALVHYALVHLVKDAPTCSGALVHASCLQSRRHLSATIYPHLHCSPSICSCETLFPYSRRCEIGEGGTMHSRPNGGDQDLTFHSAYSIMFLKKLKPGTSVTFGRIPAVCSLLWQGSTSSAALSLPVAPLLPL